mgnify:CR=1 FL=1
MTSGVLNGATDSHCHILFGVDDGVRTLEEALSVLKYDEEAGITDVWCTPHIMEDTANESSALIARFDELKTFYKGFNCLWLVTSWFIFRM